MVFGIDIRGLFGGHRRSHRGWGNDLRGSEERWNAFREDRHHRHWGHGGDYQFRPGGSGHDWGSFGRWGHRPYGGLTLDLGSLVAGIVHAFDGSPRHSRGYDYDPRGRERAPRGEDERGDVRHDDGRAPDYRMTARDVAGPARDVGVVPANYMDMSAGERSAYQRQLRAENKAREKAGRDPFAGA